LSGKGKIVHSLRNFLEIGGNPKQGGNASLPQGMGASDTMHLMHHGQTRGNEKQIKYVKTRKFYEIRGNLEK